MTKILPITTDDSNAVRLDDRPPAAPLAVGETRSITSRIQTGPMVVIRLAISPGGPGGPRRPEESTPTALKWRVEAAADDAPVSFDEGGRVTDLRVGRDLTVRFTNIGEEAAHFYAFWELG